LRFLRNALEVALLLACWILSALEALLMLTVLALRIVAGHGTFRSWVVAQTVWSTCILAKAPLGKAVSSGGRAVLVGVETCAVARRQATHGIQFS
jgi:hypothetical protein